MQGMTGAVFLGLGRAVGETMAVLFVIGNVPKVTASLFAPGTTIASQLANDFGEAEGIFQSTLFELGLILLSMSFLIQVAGQLWLNRVRASSGRGL
jgi:phosphate transport system permease protein